MNITKNGLLLSIVLLTTFNAVKGADSVGAFMLQAATSVKIWEVWAFTKGPLRVGGVITGTLAGLLQAHGIPITEKENGKSTLILPSALIGIATDMYIAHRLNDDTPSYGLADSGSYACKFIFSALVSAGITYTGRKAISKIAGALPDITARTD